MNQYAVLIRLSHKLYLGEDADAEQGRRLWEIMKLLFSFGPAWSATGGGVLLQTELSHSELVTHLSPLVEAEDFVAIIEMSAKAITAIGYDWEPEDLEALYPGVTRIEGVYQST